MTKQCSLGVVLAFIIGCGSQDADCLSKVGNRLGQAVRGVVAVHQQRLCVQVPLCGDADSIDIRVTRRLKWDKALAELPLQVRAGEDGIELRGQVPNETMRRRALEIAEATLGVEHVRDLLEVSAFVPAETEPKQ